jgi:hypothetical protein
MPTNTYDALRSTTVTGSPVSSVTFDLTGISGYTDLVVIADVTMSSPTGTTYIVGRVGNGTIDTGSNYSSTVLVGNGSSGTSYRTGSVSYFQCDTYITGSNRAMFQTNLQSYANTSVNKTILGRTSSAATNISAIAARWASNSAITTIQFYDFSGNNFAVGSTFSLYGIAAEGAGPTAKATGGMITSDSTYYYHTFRSTGVFTPSVSLSADLFMVAGGGGGGTGDNNGTGGGGGAGGYRLLSAQTIPATACTVTVGAGGSVLTSGSNSSIAGSGLTTISSTGGGRASGLTTPAASGGSGGGGGGNNLPTGGAGNAGGYSPVEGYAGGTNVAFSGAGGGGAAGIGIADTWNGSTGTAGNGGPGTAINATWASAVGFGVNGFIAGGGGGGRDGKRSMTAAVGGVGGGGNGCSAGLSGQPGTANSGGGGGGGGNLNSTEYVAAAGGSGIVIVRYLKA